MLFRKGDPGDVMFAVAEGQIELSVDGTIVEEVGPGGILGELALIDASPRATAIAVTPSRVVRVDQQHFRYLVQGTRRLRLQVMTVSGRPAPQGERLVVRITLLSMMLLVVILAILIVIGMLLWLGAPADMADCPSEDSIASPKGRSVRRSGSSLSRCWSAESGTGSRSAVRCAASRIPEGRAADHARGYDPEVDVPLTWAPAR